MEDSFKERGLLKVALPRERITPLMIIQKVADGTGEIIGSVEELFTSTTMTLPLDVKDEKVSEFSGGNTAKMNMEAGLSFLQGIWSKLGKGDLKGEFKKDDVFSFHFNNLLRDSIKSEITLSSFIFSSIATLEANNPYRQALKNGDLYVVTSVLKSNDFTITVQDEKTGEGKLSLGLKDLFDVDIKAGGSNVSNESIKNNGGYMIFALRAKQIFYHKNIFGKEKFSLENPDIEKVLGPEQTTSNLTTGSGLIEIVK